VDPFAIRVDIEPSIDVAEVERRLAASFDRPIGDRRRVSTVGPWTVFGEIAGGTVRVETAGAFEGWRARDGYGFWQPIFGGRITSSGDHARLSGAVRFRRTVWIVFGFLVTLTIGLVPPLLASAGRSADVAGVEAAIPALALIGGIVIIPWAWTLHSVRMGRREAWALRRRLEASLSDPGWPRRA
jgi:hypothetical protein